MADIHRPRQRQRHQVEHAAPVPPPAVALPEQRMLDAFALHPVPVLRPPPPRVLVAAGVDELEKPRVRHVVPLDGERRHVGGARGELVVPSERHRFAVDAERRRSRAESRSIRRPAPRLDRAGDRLAGRRFCSNGRRCHMYSSVSWCIASCSRMLKTASARSRSGSPGRSRSSRASASSTRASASSANCRTSSRAGHRATSGRPACVPARSPRIDAAREQRFEPRVDARPAERPSSPAC